MSKRKQYVFRSPGGGKLHVPTDDGVETFEADVPRPAPAKMIEGLRKQGYLIEDAEPSEEDAEKPESGDDEAA